MSPPLFLTDRLALDAPLVRLDGPEGRHAAQVRRLGVGEVVELTDGFGGWASCVVTGVEASRGIVELSVERRRQLPAPTPRLVVVQALAKGDRGELAVETMTEVGVDEIVPWRASRCIARWEGERGAKALSRWRATAREAAKQSRRPWLPVVTEPVSTTQVAGRLAGAALAVVLHEEAVTPLATVSVPRSGEIIVVVGPEGGIAPEELAAFASAGAPGHRLGPTVLRTSTAGVVAAGVLLAASGRWEPADG